MRLLACPVVQASQAAIWCQIIYIYTYTSERATKQLSQVKRLGRFPVVFGGSNNGETN